MLCSTYVKTQRKATAGAPVSTDTSRLIATDDESACTGVQGGICTPTPDASQETTALAGTEPIPKASCILYVLIS